MTGSHPHATRTSCIKIVQQRCCEIEKDMHMKASFLTADMIADFKSKGGKIERCERGASSGYRKRDWDRLVRGDKEEVVSDIAPAPKRELRLRAGHGAIA